MDYKSFDLEVNPYDLLGVPRGCRDLKEIKKAYRKKSLLYHPDRGRDSKRPETDFPTLNKCYIYLKTLCMELEGEIYNVNPEDKMRDLRSQYESRSLPGDNGYNGGSSRQSGTQKQRKPDFEKPVIDNSVIGEDAFNHDRILAEMMSYRPTSTSYQDIGGYGETIPENPFKGNRRFNLDRFNEHFEQRQQHGNVMEASIDGFTGFDEMGSAASIVSDGQYMFVQGIQKNPTADSEESAAYGPVCSFGLLKEHAEYDRNLEKERYASIGKDAPFVSDMEVQKFSRMYENCGESAAKKLNKAQFADRMRFMEVQHQENLISQKRRHQSVVEEQMKRLSDMTRANLQNHLLIE